MKSFPDESKMERSKDGSELIRGGSIGLNRILNRFVDRSNQDRNPEFTACLISAFTVFRNVVGTYPDLSIEEIEQAFVKDINLFLEYYDIYIAITKNAFMNNKCATVIVYFPDYSHVEKEILKDQTGKSLELFTLYKKFLSRYSGRDEMIKKTEHVLCYFISAGPASYPHRDISRKFRSITSDARVIYSSGDKVALITHIPLDYHLGGRLRNIVLLESYTGKLRPQKEFNLKLDKEGRLPFTTTAHVVFGDGVLIKPMITPKIRKLLFEYAEKDKWISRSDDDVRLRISKLANIPLNDLRKFDFV
jgi:hypothetical protein